ncbi:MAG: 2-C-methyl-D-erythritol 4-phosphate cytidylyltransferase [Bacteroidetes bacterium 4572_117]|nr:MAG: 2-C-methyl-D-erythritol 4-phosphate cytidylyltransferase [Bacteroidetes bacterium 4572_117]
MNSVIIVAGGSGSRFKSNIPKQFVELKGKPILMHSIIAFYKFQKDIEIIIILPEKQLDFWYSLCKKHDFNIKHKVIKGGKTRFESVKNGLDTIKLSENMVAIHDGVRPLVSQDTIERCFNEAKISGNAIPTILPVDSVRQVSGNTNSPIDRSGLRLIQTPQVFKTGILKNAYNQAYKEMFTDDASVLEAMGEQIKLVEGNRENIKITNNIDLILAKALCNIA